MGSVPKILSRTAPPLPSSPALENVATNHKLKISECLRSHDATISFHRACIGAFIRLVTGIQGSDQLWCLLFGGGKSSGSLWRWILLPLPGLLQTLHSEIGQARLQQELRNSLQFEKDVLRLQIWSLP